MKPRFTHVLFVLTALAVLGGGVAALLYLPDFQGPRGVAKKAALKERAAQLLPGLRGGAAPAPDAPAAPTHIQASGPIHVQATPPDPPAPPEPPRSTISALEALPPISSLPQNDDTPPEEPNSDSGLEGAVSLPAPLPPARPGDLSRLTEKPATPLPPRRPGDLKALAALTPPAALEKPEPPQEPQQAPPQETQAEKPLPIEPAPQPAAAGPANAPSEQPAAAPSAPVFANLPLPPVRPANLAALAPATRVVAPAQSPATQAPGADGALQQVARLPEPGLQPAPDDAFQQGPQRFGMGSPVFIRIFKQEGQLELYLRRSSGRYALYKTYPICKWSGHLGPKLREADYQSPEGFYSVSAKQLHPHSNYHRAFNVGYPNAFDRQNGRTGGLVMVHGSCKSVGCFAMTDAGIEEIYGFVDAALRAGQKEIPVHIFPFHMTEHAIARETGGGWLSFASAANAAQWGDFWRNLKEGYDLFEHTGEPPVAYACGDHYAFGAAGASCRRVAGW